jgi:hypothetical protein
LNEKIGKILKDYDKLSTRAVDAAGKAQIDPRMYAGSGGILMALYKFI